MDILERIFGNRDKVKIIRLFLLNEDAVFDTGDVAKRANSPKRKAGRELQNLLKARFLKRKIFNKTSSTGKKIKKKGWILDKKFPFLTALKNLLVNKDTISDKNLIGGLNKIGKLKLIITAGIFIQNDEYRVDLFLVADQINETVLNRAIKKLEAEIGKEIKYAVFDSIDFKYRFGMYDKLIRDVFDYPHRVILDKIGLDEKLN